MTNLLIGAMSIHPLHLHRAYTATRGPPIPKKGLDLKATANPDDEHGTPVLLPRLRPVVRRAKRQPSCAAIGKLPDQTLGSASAADNRAFSLIGFPHRLGRMPLWTAE